MDTWAGNSQDPITLHKYLYAHASPTMYTDPSGNFVDTLGTFAVNSALQSTVRTVSVNVILRRLAVKLFFANMAVESIPMLSTQLQSKKAREELAVALKEKVDQAAHKVGKKKEDLVFHYTDMPAAQDIMMEQCIYATPFFKHPVDHLARPSGAYATDIPPWAPMSEKSLESALFAFPKGRDLSAFVALDKKGFTHVKGTPEWYKPGKVGRCVPVNALLNGPNLMR